MLLRKYMSLLGIGSAQIDLALPKESYTAGEIIKGFFVIKGGTIDQKAKRIECDLVMTERSTGLEKIVATTTILSSKIIQSEKEYKISFTFKIPDTIQVSTEDISYHFKTRLSFNEGTASKDLDIIHII
ncbi:sporulation protein [Lederbergia lenta]|uniref:Sporulation-control protein Spo0M n=1 Tax=Lederbergia lenta TaxID=1467 RepID=A0A2X4VLJ6_LEDLE|nr:sporulation protein [Lederbergia lenta]MCM3112400.1 sporulation protein [Lederbergia lenta]MEC2326618.1 sporulation protein [Lederbergia lenta]SQI53017.1 sporulation-control protein Spo0M [Lederbergia lenta]